MDGHRAVRARTVAAASLIVLLALGVSGSVAAAETSASPPAVSSLSTQLVHDPIGGGVPYGPVKVATFGGTPTPREPVATPREWLEGIDTSLSKSFQLPKIVPIETIDASWHPSTSRSSFVGVEIGRFTFPRSMNATESGAYVQSAFDSVKKQLCSLYVQGSSIPPAGVSSIPGAALLSCGDYNHKPLSAIVFSAGNTVALLASTTLTSAQLRRVADAQYVALPRPSALARSLEHWSELLVALAAVIGGWGWTKRRRSRLLARGGSSAAFRYRSDHPKTSFLMVHLRQAALVMLVVTFVTTMLAGLLPGGPLSHIYDANLGIGGYLGWRLGYDDSIWIQYWHWLDHAFHGSLGYSTLYPVTVDGLISNRAPVTIELALLTMTLSLVIAIPLAMISAEMPGGKVDGVITTITSFAASMPVYIAGIFFVEVFAVQNRWLPSQGWIPLGVSLTGNIRHAILPVLALTIGVFPMLLKVLRGDLVALSNEEFVLAARSRGLPESYVMTHHMFRPAAASLITVMGMAFGTIISGSFLVEFFFTIPGLGFTVWNAVNNTDIPVLQGVVIVMALTFVVINALVDIGYWWLDPRVRIT